jgi:hypothetical protein
VSAVAVPATSGRWLDSDTPLSDAVLDLIAAGGYVGVFRYCPLPGNNPLYDISRGELERILAKGLQLSLVQHVRGTLPRYLWRPADHDGAADAHHAAGHALGCGFPIGAHLAQDLEACDGRTMGPEIEKYCTDWGNSCKASGLIHRLYVGYAVPLSAQELYELPTPNSYWSDMGDRHVAVRGFDTKQGASLTLGGVEFDSDEVKADALGSVFMCAAAAAPNA